MNKHFMLAITTVCLATISSRADELPPDLARIPSDVAAFVCVDVSSVKSIVAPELKWALAGLTAKDWDTFQKMFAFDPATVKRVVIATQQPARLFNLSDTVPDVASEIIMVTFTKPIDPDEFGKAVLSAGQIKSHRGQKYRYSEDSDNCLLVLPGNQTVVYCSEKTVAAMVNPRTEPRETGALASLRSEALRHSVLIAIALDRVIPAEALGPFAAVGKAKRGVILANVTQSNLGLTCRFDYADNQAARNGVDAIKAGISAGRNGMNIGIQYAQNIIIKPGTGKNKLHPSEMIIRFPTLVGLGALRQLDTILAKMPVTMQGTSVTVQIAELPPSTFASWTVVAIAAITALGENSSKQSEMNEPIR